MRWRREKQRKEAGVIFTTLLLIETWVWPRAGEQEWRWGAEVGWRWWGRKRTRKHLCLHWQAPANPPKVLECLCVRLCVRPCVRAQLVCACLKFSCSLNTAGGADFATERKTDIIYTVVSNLSGSIHTLPSQSVSFSLFSTCISH